MRALVVALVLVVVGCGDDEPTPEELERREQRVDELLDALCEDSKVGDTMVIAGDVYRRDADDCP